MEELRPVIEPTTIYQMVDYGHVRVKLAEVLDSRGISRNRLASLTGTGFIVVDRYYKSQKKPVQMVDLDFMSRICYALDCTLEDLLEYVPPEKEKAE